VVTSPATMATPVFTSVSAGDAPRAFVLGDDRVQHRIGNLVSDLVRMAFGHGFGREKILAQVAILIICLYG